MEFYVSNSENINNLGTITMPFSSIEEAKLAVREINRKLKRNITVYLRQGNYYVNGSLRFDQEDSGFNGYKVIYKNYQGEEVNIIGGKRISNWEACENGIYKAKLGSNFEVNSLFENNVRATQARFPKKGYDKVLDKVDNFDCEKFVFNKNNYPKGFDKKYVSANIWPGKSGWNWFSEIHPLENINFDSGELTLENKAMYGIDKGARFFLQGSKSFLTEKGEFYFDREKSELYYIPITLPIENQEIIAATTKSIINIKGKWGYEKVSNIHFEGLNFRISDIGNKFLCTDAEHGVNDDLSGRNGIFLLENCEHITIKNCRIENSGLCGVVLNKYCQNITLSHNHISNCGYNGINLAGVPIGRGNFKSAEGSYVNKLNTIEDNHISGCGLIIGHGSGIQLNMSGDNIIRNNTISNCSRYGISLKGSERYGKMAEMYYGTKVTWDNHWSFLHSRNNLITYNEIIDCMKNSQDGGLFESWSAGKGNKVCNNIFRDSDNSHIGGYLMGIYLDDASDFFTIENNLIYGLKGESTIGVSLKGFNNKFINNVVAHNIGNPPSSAEILFHDAEPNSHLIITSNIFYNTSNSGLFQFNTENWDEWDSNKFTDFSKNTVFHSSGEYHVELTKDSTGEKEIISYDEWKKRTGYPYQIIESFEKPNFDLEKRIQQWKTRRSFM